jgi:hypothetical protein
MLMAVYFQFLGLLIVLASHCALSLNFVLDHTARIQLLLSCSVIGSSFVLGYNCGVAFCITTDFSIYGTEDWLLLLFTCTSRVHVLGICRIPE